MEFTVGQKVKFLNGNWLNKKFEIVSWNDSENKGRIEDESGRGRYVCGYQIIVVEDVEDWDSEESEDEEEDDG